MTASYRGHGFAMLLVGSSCIDRRCDYKEGHFGRWQECEDQTCQRASCLTAGPFRLTSSIADVEILGGLRWLRLQTAYRVMTEYEGPPWCEVNWQGIRYRAATSGLLPINAATTPTKMTHVSTALDLWVLCAANPDTALWVFARAFLPRDAHGSQRA